jgi:hypothetical protein
MIAERAVTVLLAVLVIILVAVVQERSRYLAAIIATMPVTAPLGDLDRVLRKSRRPATGRRLCRVHDHRLCRELSLRVSVLVRFPAGLGAPSYSGVRLRRLATDRVDSALGRKPAAMTRPPSYRAAVEASRFLALIEFRRGGREKNRWWLTTGYPNLDTLYHIRYK